MMQTRCHIDWPPQSIPAWNRGTFGLATVRGFVEEDYRSEITSAGQVNIIYLDKSDLSDWLCTRGREDML